MVTSKKFHTYLILLVISAVFSILGALTFVTQINKVPHVFEWLGLFSFFSSILTLIVVANLKKTNRAFLDAFICNIFIIAITSVQIVLMLFDDFNLVVKAVEEGIDFTVEIIGLIINFYIINGIRDCYDQEDVKDRKVFKIYIRLIIGFFIAAFVTQMIAGLDFFVKNYFVATIARLTSVLFELALPIVLTVCYSRAAKMSSNVLKAKKQEEGGEQNEKQ